MIRDMAYYAGTLIAKSAGPMSFVQTLGFFSAIAKAYSPILGEA